MLIIATFLAVKTMLTGGETMEPGGADVPLFETPAWQASGMLLVRSEEEEEGALLLKHSERETVYRYDPETQSLSGVASDIWQNAREPIGDCELQSGQSPQVLRIDPKSGQLLVDNRPITTTGATPLAILGSPSGNRVAVLSAEGPMSGSILPFLGRGGASGQHYHQVFSLPGVLPVWKSVRLPLSSEKVTLTACWSPNERYVIYADILFFSIVVVDIYGR